MPVRALLQGRNRGYFTYLPLQMFLQQALTGNQQQSADIRQHLRGSLGIHGPDEVLIDIILFFQAKVFHGLAVVPLYLFLGVAQVFAQLVGAAGAKRVGGEREVDPRPGNLPQLVDHVVHVLHKGVVVAVAGVALGAE